jgi:hypothetical protein
MGYTDAGILKNTNRWMKLILAVICLGIPFNGYVLRVYRGADPAPDVDEWGTLFVDGLKMLAISVVYILPLMLLMFILIGAMMVATVIGGEARGVFAGILGALANVLFYVLEFIVMALLPVAFIRFARTGVFAEAFNFAAMRETIGKIGWITYIVAVVLIALIIGIPVCILLCVLLAVLIGAAILPGSNLAVVFGAIAVLVILFLIVIPVISIFQARYLTRVYGSAGE